MKSMSGAALTLAALMAGAPAVAQQATLALTQLARDPWAEAPADASGAQARRDDTAPFQRDLVAPPRRDRLFLSYGPRFIWGDPAERDYARESRNQQPREALRLENERSGVRY